jgi:hypothetical protein
MSSTNKLFSQIQTGQIVPSAVLEREWDGLYRESTMRMSLTELLGFCWPVGGQDVPALAAPGGTGLFGIGGDQVMGFQHWLVDGGPARASKIMKLAAREPLNFKLLLYFKMLEEIVLNSKDEATWRPVMMELAKPIVPGLSMVPYHIEASKIATLCLERILVVENRAETPDKAKLGLATEILSAALFHYTDSRNCALAVDALAIHSRESSIAPFLALSSLMRRNTTPTDARLFLDGHLPLMHHLFFGDDTSLALIARGMTPERKWVVEEVCRHMQRLFDTSSIVTPHPLFTATGGYPLPRLPRDGLHQHALFALGEITSPAAFVAMVDGISRLLLPHIGDQDTPRQIKESIPPIAESLVESGRRLSVPGIDRFAMTFLTHPKPPKPMKLSRAAVEELVPFATRLVLTGSYLADKPGRTPRALRVAEAVLAAQMHLEGRTRELSPEALAKMLLERHTQVFNGLGAAELAAPQRFAEALRAFTAPRTEQSGTRLILPKRLKSRAGR